MANSTLQIKVTVSEQEKQKLEQEAAAIGKSVSSLAHDKLFPAVKEFHKNQYTNDELIDTHIKLPKPLYESLKEGAAEYGYSISKYLSILVAQKGKPVLLEFNYLSSIQQVATLNQLAKDIRNLSKMAAQQGQLYKTNLTTIELECRDLITALKENIKAMDKTERTTLKRMQRHLNGEIKKAKSEES